MPEVTSVKLECVGINKVGEQYQNCFSLGSIWLDHPLELGQRYRIIIERVADDAR